MIGVLQDPFQSAAIVVWMVITLLLIRRVNRLSRRLDEPRVIYRSMEIQDPQPVCGCGHHQCFHDETGCGKEETWQKYDSERYVQPCGCKRYTGPEQLPTVIP